jgi:hypothetical protein
MAEWAARQTRHVRRGSGMLANACGKVSTAKLTVAPSDVVAVYCMGHSLKDGGFTTDHHTQECSVWRSPRERISPTRDDAK